MKLIRDPLRLVEAAGQATAILTAVLAPYRSFALAPQRVAVSVGVLAGLTLAVYALHAVTFDHFRLIRHGRSPGVTVPLRRTAEGHGPAVVTAAAAPRT